MKLNKNRVYDFKLSYPDNSSGILVNFDSEPDVVEPKSNLSFQDVAEFLTASNLTAKDAEKSSESWKD
jgi:hypothetical protein